MKSIFLFSALVLTLAPMPNAIAMEPERFGLMDVFSLEFASDPQISPDGEQIVYVRNFMDVAQDRRRSNLWVIRVDGSRHRPLTSGDRNDTAPRWSPDGERIAWISMDPDRKRPELTCRWMDSGQSARVASLQSTPANLLWSPDGKSIAFSMHVPETSEPFVDLPAKPEGANWADPAKVIRRVIYRADGKGYVKDGYHQLFVVTSEGGTPRQLTKGPYNHTSLPCWTPDSAELIFSANRKPEWEYDQGDTELYSITLANGTIRQLTERDGPDNSPAMSSDGKQIAFTGFDDERKGYQVSQLYVMKSDGSKPRVITTDLDRDVVAPKWNSDGSGLFFQYDDRGTTKIGLTTLDGKVRSLAENIGGTTLGRPYASGSFSASENGTIAFSQSRPDYPADVSVVVPGSSESKRLTRLNDDLFAHKTLAATEELWYKSSFDERMIQGWIVKPPGFDRQKTYPLILEIHGGPFANYGDRFSAEIQLYAAAGYIVLYTNPRGSTGYGQEFADLIHHNYPGEGDFQDLMSGVDELVRRGMVDANRLFVTGGSGGGILTAWVVGKTNRFQAAVAQKPVINWYSFVLTTDIHPYFTRHWFPGFPWDHAEHYLKRSPLTLVGNVTTPTMLLTGEVDHRTPMSESEQFYQALKLRKVDSLLVRIPDASHAIVARPSRMIVKVAHILKWFETYDQK